VRSTKGVSHVVRSGFVPATVGATILDTIKSFEASQNQASLADMSNFKAGQRVKFKHVAFRSMEGLVHGVSSKRVAVLLDILGLLTEVKVEHHQLEALN
jgi:transcriptional antiterminator RfaH